MDPEEPHRHALVLRLLPGRRDEGHGALRQVEIHLHALQVLPQAPAELLAGGAVHSVGVRIELAWREGLIPQAVSRDLAVVRGQSATSVAPVVGRAREQHSVLRTASPSTCPKTELSSFTLPAK
eukprot:9060439-Lingulodinium_polyedra.AAC.1